jgi:[ribosomal protein S18]-alanine N-acetyltransferase
MNDSSDVTALIRDWRIKTPDITMLTRLDEVCFPGVAWDRDTWQGLFVHRRLRSRLVMVRSEPVGYIAYTVFGDEAEVLRIGVHPAFRRQSLATRLLRSALDEMALDGVRKVWLEVRSDDTPAVTLYRSQGFIMVSKRNGYYRRPIGDALVLFKGLPFTFNFPGSVCRPF